MEQLFQYLQQLHLLMESMFEMLNRMLKLYPKQIALMQLKLKPYLLSTKRL